MGTLVNPFISFPGAASTPASFVVGSMQSHVNSTVNLTTISMTHTFTSTTQDGTVYLIIGVAIDNFGTEYDAPAGWTPVLTDDGDNAAGGAAASEPTMGLYRYKPTQGELDTGTIDFDVTITNGGEAGHFVSCEIIANATTPVEDTASDLSTADRQTAGPVSVTPTSNSAVLIAFIGAEDSVNVTIDTSTANGFTFPIGASDPDAAGNPACIMGYREVSTATAYDSPLADSTVTDEGVGIIAAAFGAPA